MSIGETIKNLRVQHDMKQWELAHRLSVDLSTVSKWEHDRSTPSIYTLNELCIIFGVKLEEFKIQSEKERINNE